MDRIIADTDRRISTPPVPLTPPTINPLAGSGGKPQSRGPRYCALCQRKTHRTDDCYELPTNESRRPAGWKSRLQLDGKLAASTKPQGSSSGATTHKLSSAMDEQHIEEINSLGLSHYSQSSRLSVASIGQALDTASAARWLIDSGCSHHITGNRSAFLSYESIKSFPLLTADNRPVCVVGRVPSALNWVLHRLICWKMCCTLLAFQRIYSQLVNSCEILQMHYYLHPQEPLAFPHPLLIACSALRHRV